MSNSERYRPELDGVRAVAVIIVILFHANPDLVPGGFVGVDVFFVLSGYFMADIISREIDEHRFTFVNFYLRRIRRIFPALAVVIIVSSIFAWKLLMPAEMVSFARSVRAVVLLFPNFYFERENGYFDLDTHMKPLLHTWSLGVEEQFYLLFPLALVLLRRYASGSTRNVIIAATAISFIAATWCVVSDPTAAFYLMPFRLWELLVGALAAFIRIRMTVRTGNVISILGLCGITAAALFFDSETVFPGPAAALPCLSTALIIVGGQRSQVALAALANRPIVFTGKTSYSMYLWHWPILVFLPYFLPLRWNAWSVPTVVLSSFVAGYLSWRFVEQPFRFKSFSVRPVFIFAIFAVCVLCTVFLANYVRDQAGLPNRLPAEALKFYSAKLEVNPFYQEQCFADSGKGLDDGRILAGNLCRIGASDKIPTFILWGDSHAAAIAPAVDESARRHGLAGLFVGRAGCPPLADGGFGAQDQVKRCAASNQAVLELIKKREFSAVFMAAYWPKYFHRAELPNAGIFFDATKPVPLEDWSAPVITGLDKSLTTVVESHSKPVLILDVPEMGFDVPEKLAREVMVGGSFDIAPPIAYTLRRQESSRRHLIDVGSSFHADIVDPLPFICSEKACRVIWKDSVLYRDTDHLTRSGSVLLAPLFDKIMSRSAGGLLRPSS